MKIMIAVCSFLMASSSFAAIQVKCSILSEVKYSSMEDVASYDVTTVTQSLPEGHVTGSVSLKPVQGRLIEVSISASAEGGPFVSSICASDASLSVCSAEKSSLVLKSSDEKSTISCTAQ